MFNALKTNRKLRKEIEEMELDHLVRLNRLIDERDLAYKIIENDKQRINELEDALFEIRMNNKLTADKAVL